ncbi:hypothetical protein [Streptomyces sp. NPDC058398]|uniref:hypothetical protein n=1 Tax=Streptomyces sp. NPDC058398 TaxID=3346479 RepID=UPI00365012BF
MSGQPPDGAAPPVYLSSIAYELGARTPLERFGTPVVEREREALRAEGIVHCRVTTETAWELAAHSAQRTLADASRPAADGIVYSSESFGAGGVTTDLWDLLRGLGTPRTPALVVNGNGCGNLALALGVARNSVRADGHSEVLVAVADRLDDPDERYQPNGQTILSDGAASCLVGTRMPDAGFRLLGISVRYRADFDHGAVPAMAGVRVVMAGVEEAVEDLRAKVPPPADGGPEYSRLVTGNYGASTRSFLALATGVDTAADYAPHAADMGHCFAADLLVNLATLQEHKEVRPGERLLLLATSSRSWSAMAVEYVTA